MENILFMLKLALERWPSGTRRVLLVTLVVVLTAPMLLIASAAIAQEPARIGRIQSAVLTGEFELSVVVHGLTNRNLDSIENLEWYIGLMADPIEKVLTVIRTRVKSRRVRVSEWNLPFDTCKTETDKEVAYSNALEEILRTGAFLSNGDRHIGYDRMMLHRSFTELYKLETVVMDCWRDRILPKR